MNEAAELFQLSDELRELLKDKKIIIPESRSQIFKLAMGGSSEIFEVAYDVEGIGTVVEATVTKCKNGLAVNYIDKYMRRRDPDCMVIADEGDTDKTTYFDRFGKDFEPLRSKTFEWLKSQEELIVMPFMSGGHEFGFPSLLIVPANTAFFAGGLADLQGFIPKSEIPANFCPKAVIYLAPPFRHTHFGGKQVVVHNRIENMHELFSFNLYPGPSAKKGVYGILLNIGESEGWVTLGYSNPSISDSEGLASEGVGSYWPFATGKMVTQANLLIVQMLNTPATRYMLIPNQHIGAYKVGFMPEWIDREYLARRGSAKFKKEQLIEALCPLLGYSVESLKIDGTFIPTYLLRVNEQAEVGNIGYDKGATILNDFFKKEARKFYCDEIHPKGKEIIEIRLNDGKLEDYLRVSSYQ